MKVHLNCVEMKTESVRCMLRFVGGVGFKFSCFCASGFSRSETDCLVEELG